MQRKRGQPTTHADLPRPGRIVHLLGGLSAPGLAADAERSLSPDALIARIAALQHGSVSRAQALASGLSDRAVEHRLATGRWSAIHRGVYLVGPIEGPLTRHAAALLACGPGAVLSHRTAAALWGLPVTPRAIEVTVVGRGGRVRRPGITVHRPNELAAADVRTRERLPLTSPAACLLETAPLVTPRDLARITEEAERRQLVTRAEIEQRLAPGKRGAAKLRTVLARYDTPSLTRSEAEARMLGLIRAAGLPRPVTNARVMTYEVDLLWPRERVVVEVDGFAFHATRPSWERDRARDAHLHASGYLVLRFTWREITQERETVIARLAATLAMRAPTPPAPAR